MEKRKLLMAICLAACTGCFAQDDITVNLSSGKKVYKLDDLKSMTFEGNNLKVNKKTDDADTYSFSEIVSISFDTTTGVEGLKVAGGKLTVSVKPGSDRIEIGGYDSNENYTVAIYSLSGEKVYGINNWRGETVDVSSLSNGVYVFKINNTAIKFRK